MKGDIWSQEFLPTRQKRCINHAICDAEQRARKAHPGRDRGRGRDSGGRAWGREVVYLLSAVGSRPRAGGCRLPRSTGPWRLALRPAKARGSSRVRCSGTDVRTADTTWPAKARAGAPGRGPPRARYEPGRQGRVCSITPPLQLREQADQGPQAPHTPGAPPPPSSGAPSAAAIRCGTCGDRGLLGDHDTRSCFALKGFGEPESLVH